jgi:hypothetical protein
MFQIDPIYPVMPPGEARKPKLCFTGRAAEAGFSYLFPPQVGNGIEDFGSEGGAGRLTKGKQAQRRALFLIFFSNGPNDIINCQEGVHHLRIKVLA